MAVEAGTDLNMEIAGELYDLAFIHDSKHARIAYRRAARAVVGLEVSLRDFVRDHAPREIPYVGPASERVIFEHLEQGKSLSVERAVEQSPRRSELETARSLRSDFLSRAEALRILKAPAEGTVGLQDYRGDLQM